MLVGKYEQNYEDIFWMDVYLGITEETIGYMTKQFVRQAIFKEYRRDTLEWLSKKFLII